jgi:hypothetical protein
LSPKKYSNIETKEMTKYMYSEILL